MQVVTVSTSTGQTRYYLANDDGTPVEPVLQYLKFRDNGGAARNTLRLACIFMKHYFTYLEKRGLRWQAVTIDDLADFLAWLKYPRIEEKVIPLNLEPKYRAETINAILDTVLAFYHYEYLRGGLGNDVSERLVTFIKSPHGAYRSFLDGIADRRRTKRYLLRLPTPRHVLRTVTKEEVETVMEACVNIRDYFLMYLLFETGMRIGEALSLWLEDFDISDRQIRIGIIQRLLGHCSLQMSLHYAKVSEDTMYQKWKSTERLDLFRPATPPPGKTAEGDYLLHYEKVRPNLDAVRVPFGVCFKPSKAGCRRQTEQCLECPSFCSTKENTDEYDAEITRVQAMIDIGLTLGRKEWVDKNREYLDRLTGMQTMLAEKGIIHKSGSMREA